MLSSLVLPKVSSVIPAGYRGLQPEHRCLVAGRGGTQGYPHWKIVQGMMQQWPGQHRKLLFPNYWILWVKDALRIQDLVFLHLLLPDSLLRKITCSKLNALTHKTNTCTDLLMKWRCWKDRASSVCPHSTALWQGQAHVARLETQTTLLHVNTKNHF